MFLLFLMKILIKRPSLICRPTQTASFTVQRNLLFRGSCINILSLLVILENIMFNRRKKQTDVFQHVQMIALILSATKQTR